MKIHIISDNKKTRELLIGGLTGLLPAGTAFRQGGLGAAGMMLSKEKPSALVLDIDCIRNYDAENYIEGLCPRHFVPIIVLTVRNSSRASLINAGAVDIIRRPTGDKDDDKLFGRLASSIIGSANVVRPKNLSGSESGKVIVVGGSTGSTGALPVLLKGLPADCPPVVCVLHMPEGYTKLYAAQLDASLPLQVVEAKTGTYLKRGMVVIAAGGKHLRLFRDRKGYFVTSEAGVKVNGHCPSVDVLFDSAAYSAKKDAIGVILTGMGSDGAKGMLDMRKMGAYNIAEAESSAVVYGMPKAAAENGAANISLSLDNIAGHIISKIK